MDKEHFCDNFCPVPMKFYDVEETKNGFAECYLLEENCPFSGVDFSKVVERGVCCEDCQQDRDWCPDCYRGDLYRSPDVEIYFPSKTNLSVKGT